MNPAILLGTLRGSVDLARAVLEAGHVDLIVLYDSAADALKRRGIPCMALNAFLDDGLRQYALQQAEQRAVAVTKAFYRESFRRHWAHVTDPAWRAIRQHTVNLAARDFAENILLIELIQRCIAAVDLRLVVVQEDYGRDTSVAIRAAHRYGVPALHILHGIPYQTQAGHDTLAADVVAAQGARARDVLTALGMRHDRVVVTGAPEWDCYAKPLQLVERKQARAELGLDPGRPVVGYAGTFPHAFSATAARHAHYHDETSDAVFRALAALQAEHPDWQFAIRSHPGDQRPAAEWIEWTRRAGLRDARISRDDSHPFLVSLDVLLCTHSNIGVEALLCGLPVINVALDAVAGPMFDEDFGPLFRDDDPVFHARHADGIANAVNRAMLDPEARSALAGRREARIGEFQYLNDGGAMKRVCDLIVEMAHAPERFAPPVTRFAEFENALARALPEGLRRVGIAGTARNHALDALHALHPATVFVEIDNDTPGHALDAVVLSDPVPHDESAEPLLRQLFTALNSDGSIIAPFRHGGSRSALDAFASGTWAPPRAGWESGAPVGHYAMTGIDVLLSRLGLDREQCFSITQSGATEGVRTDSAVEGWVIRARPAGGSTMPHPHGAFAERRAAAVTKAREANARGEALFGQGDIRGAIDCFAAAINAWGRDAVAHNNLGSALASLGYDDDAYSRIRDALHFDPSLRSARENLRIVGARLGREVDTERLLDLFGPD